MDGVEFESGLLSFDRNGHDFGHDLERTIMEALVDAVQIGALQPIERYMREVEDELSLPGGSLARLPADAEFR